ncbi:MAG: HNH endonuclease [Halanaerobiales bacterium]|nr:HNH endonuclease [Halanaerobiales bacterium]
MSNKKICFVENCDRDYSAKGLCKMHYKRWKKHGDPYKTLRVLGQKGCLVKDCENKHKAKGYCKYHYQQMLYYGKIPERTQYTANEFIDLGDNITEIILYNKKHKEVTRSLIDTDRVSLLKNYKWCLSGHRYVMTKVNNKSMFLHWFVVGYPLNSFEIDHINRKPLDNREKNLRRVTHSQNLQNQSIRFDNTSGYKGVSWSKRSQKWRAYITINNKEKHLGYFTKIEEAVKVREQAETKTFWGN